MKTFLILLFCIYSNAYGQDTTKCLLLISDTSAGILKTTNHHSIIKKCNDCLLDYRTDTSYIYDHSIIWLRGYVVRPPIYVICLDDECPPKFIFLNNDKKPFPSNVIIWQYK